MTAIYANLFNRTPDAAGQAFWEAAISSGAVTPTQAILAIINGAQAGSTDRQILDNKVEVGLDWVTDASNTPGFTYDAAAATSATTSISGVTEDAATVTAAKAATDVFMAGTANAGSTFSLTTGIDTVTGTTGNDTINAGEVGGAVTLTAGDTIDGGAGTDVLKYATTGGAALNAAASITNVEQLEVTSGAAFTGDASGISGLTLFETKLVAGNANLTAAGTTDVTVAGTTGTITVNGGKDITVTDSNANQAIDIGGTTAAEGKATVTDSNVGTGNVHVDAKGDVSITATGSTATGNIEVGDTTESTGTITVSSTSAATPATSTLHAIETNGGTTVTVTQKIDTTNEATDTTANTITQGAVDVDGGNTTTNVTVSQSASNAAVNAVTAVAGVTETASVKFAAITAGQTIISSGLTFTAAKDLTAAEVAAAFSNLANNTIPAAGDTQGSGPDSNGVYTGDFTGWTSAAASGDTVVFTSTTANTNVADLTFAGTGAAPTVTTTAGSAETKAVTGEIGVLTGQVVIDDSATASITDVTVDGYGGASTIGAGTTLSKLANLSLANSGSTGTAGETDATMTVDAVGVSTLALSLNKVLGAVSLDGGGASVKTLNVTTSGAASTFALTAAAVETLTVAGDQVASFTADLAALKSVTVTGTAGLTLAAASGDTITSVDTSGTTGTVTTTIDGTKSTYTGGAGVDALSLATGTALTKAIDTGAGDDTVTFVAGVTGSTATLSGGAGTDTLSMAVANADALDAASQSFYTNFERLTLNDAAGDDDNTADTVAINLANLGFTNYVTTNGTLLDTTTAANSDTLQLDGLANGGTVAIAAAAAGANTKHTVNITDAATTATDVLNLIFTNAGDLNVGAITSANVETVNINGVDTEAGATPTTNTYTATLTADKATSVVLTGSQNIALTLTGSTAVTSIDGSALTGTLNVTSVNTTSATTITGGSKNDVLTAATGTTADVLIGGDGDDTLDANAGLNTLTGGAGNDVFLINTASQNVNSYATITDFAAGDLIQFTGSDSFQSAGVTLGATAVFQDYANAAMNAIGDDDVAWFQFGGDTYIVMDEGGDSTTFVNGTDLVVKITGLVDLSTASFNADDGTIGLT